MWETPGEFFPVMFPADSKSFNTGLIFQICRKGRKDLFVMLDTEGSQPVLLLYSWDGLHFERFELYPPRFKMPLRLFKREGVGTYFT